MRHIYTNLLPKLVHGVLVENKEPEEVLNVNDPIERWVIEQTKTFNKEGLYQACRELARCLLTETWFNAAGVEIVDNGIDPEEVKEWPHLVIFANEYDSYKPTIFLGEYEERHGGRYFCHHGFKDYLNK